MLSNVVALAAESGSAGSWPFIIGGGILFILFALMAGLLMFGAGRDHS